MGKKMNKFLGATKSNNTISKATQRKLRRSRKPKEAGKPKQGKKKDKKKSEKTEKNKFLDMYSQIDKLRKDLDLMSHRLDETRASGQLLQMLALMSKMRAKKQRLEQLNSEADSFISGIFYI